MVADGGSEAVVAVDSESRLQRTSKLERTRSDPAPPIPASDSRGRHLTLAIDDDVDEGLAHHGDRPGLDGGASHDARRRDADRLFAAQLAEPSVRHLRSTRVMVAQEHHVVRVLLAVRGFAEAGAEADADAEATSVAKAGAVRRRQVPIDEFWSELFVPWVAHPQDDSNFAIALLSPFHVK